MPGIDDLRHKYLEFTDSIDCQLRELFFDWVADLTDEELKYANQLAEQIGDVNDSLFNLTYDIREAIAYRLEMVDWEDDGQPSDIQEHEDFERADEYYTG
jgi:hypothetical protein